MSLWAPVMAWMRRIFTSANVCIGLGLERSRSRCLASTVVLLFMPEWPLGVEQEVERLGQVAGHRHCSLDLSLAYPPLRIVMVGGGTIGKEDEAAAQASSGYAGAQSPLSLRCHTFRNEVGPGNGRTKMMLEAGEMDT